MATLAENPQQEQKNLAIKGPKDSKFRLCRISIANSAYTKRVPEKNSGGEIVNVCEARVSTFVVEVLFILLVAINGALITIVAIVQIGTLVQRAIL